MHNASNVESTEARTVSPSILGFIFIAVLVSWTSADHKCWTSVKDVIEQLWAEKLWLVNLEKSGQL